MRQLREAAMQAACFAVDAASKRSRFLPPSPEALQWGGFLGGGTAVWTDRDAEEEAVTQIADIIRRIVR